MSMVDMRSNDKLHGLSFGVTCLLSWVVRSTERTISRKKSLFPQFRWHEQKSLAESLETGDSVLRFPDRLIEL